MLHIVAIVSDNTTDIETTTNRLLRPGLFNQLAQCYKKYILRDIHLSSVYFKAKVFTASNISYLTVQLEPTSYFS